MQDSFSTDNVAKNLGNYHESTPDFILGNPALVCRWRLAGATVPLLNRHLRALSHRMVNEKLLTPELVGWVKQHLEWNLKDGAAAHPNGVLMLVIDTNGAAALSTGPYEKLNLTRVPALLARADLSQKEAQNTGVAPESLWISQGDKILWSIEEEMYPSGCATLIEDLAKTVGLNVTRTPYLLNMVRTGELQYDEIFLCSDEHGIVTVQEKVGKYGKKFQEYYQTLLNKSSKS